MTHMARRTGKPRESTLKRLTATSNASGPSSATAMPDAGTTWMSMANSFDRGLKVGWAALRSARTEFSRKRDRKFFRGAIYLLR
ncbi:MAG: hypothetical protein ABIN96_04175 [Rubrivivax sp.]